MAKLGEVCDLIVDGNWIESKDQSESGIRLIQTGNIGNGEYLDKNNRAKYISQETFEELNCTEVFSGDILISRLPDPVGRACVVPSNLGKAITAVDCSIVRLNELVCDKQYFINYTQSERYAREIAQYLAGTTRKRISRKNLEKVEIPLPEIEEQRAIAGVLDKVSFCISKKKLQLEKLDMLVKSRFIEMFGDPKNNKSSLVKIGEIGTLSSGGTPSRIKPEYFQGTIRWYSAGELNTLFLTDSVEHISEVALQQSSAKLFHKGTLMIGMYDTAAFKMGILTEDSSSNQACANLNPKEGYNVIWLYYLFDFMKPVFLLERQGIRQKNLSLSKIREFEVPIASLDLQNQFADFVAQVDKSKLAVQKSLEQLEILKKALMQEYFG